MGCVSAKGESEIAAAKPAPYSALTDLGPFALSDFDVKKPTPDFELWEVLNTPPARARLRYYMEQEFSAENIMFCDAVEAFREEIRSVCWVHAKLSKLRTAVLPDALERFGIIRPLQSIIIEYWMLPQYDLRITGQQIMNEYCLEGSNFQVPVPGLLVKQVIQNWRNWTPDALIAEAESTPDCDWLDSENWKPKPVPPYPPEPVDWKTMTNEEARAREQKIEEYSAAVEAAGGQPSSQWFARSRKPPTPFDGHERELTKLILRDTFPRFKHSGLYQIWALAADDGKHEMMIPPEPGR